MISQKYVTASYLKTGQTILLSTLQPESFIFMVMVMAMVIVIIIISIINIHIININFNIINITIL